MNYKIEQDISNNFDNLLNTLEEKFLKIKKLKNNFKKIEKLLTLKKELFLYFFKYNCFEKRYKIYSMDASKEFFNTEFNSIKPINLNEVLKDLDKMYQQDFTKRNKERLKKYKRLVLKFFKNKISYIDLINIKIDNYLTKYLESNFEKNKKLYKITLDYLTNEKYKLESKGYVSKLKEKT